MKKLLSLLLICITVVFCGSCQSDDGADNVDYSKFNYEEISLNTVYQEYKSNKMRAEETYIGKYVCVTADVFGVYDGFLSLHEYQYNSSGIKTGYDDAWCKIMDDSLKDKMMQLNEEDKITVKGKITSLSSTGDFQVNIDVYFIEN